MLYSFFGNGNEGTTRMTMPRNSSRPVIFCGFLFLGLAIFDEIMQRPDAMTYTFLFLGMLALLIASCLQKIEKRLNSLEQSLQMSPKDRSR
jgi:hypothetical protein